MTYNYKGLEDLREEKVMEELKCCPFCGGEAEIKKEVSYAYYAECRRCEVRTKICYLEDGAIAVWNRRTQNIGKKECCEQEEE